MIDKLLTTTSRDFLLHSTPTETCLMERGSYLTYMTPPPCSTFRCQPMGTWTGTACLSSPASQSFPPFIAPLVLRSTPQRYIYQTSTSVFAMRVMFVFQSRGGGGGGGGGGGSGGRVCGDGWVMLERRILLSGGDPDGVVGQVGWGELTADPTLWAASWLRCWMLRGLPLLHLVVQSHPTREDAGWKCEVGERCAFTGRSFMMNVFPPWIQSLSRTIRVCSTYWFPNAVG